MAAVDANVFTSWQSRRGAGTGEWWEIELDAATELYGATVQFVRNPFEGRSVTRVRVATDQGAKTYRVPATGLLTLDTSGQSSRLRISVTGVQGTTGPDDSVGIAEVRIPNVVGARPARPGRARDADLGDGRAYRQLHPLPAGSADAGVHREGERRAHGL